MTDDFRTNTPSLRGASRRPAGGRLSALAFGLTRALVALLMLVLVSTAAHAQGDDAGRFDAWLDSFRDEARRSGISETTLAAAFADVSLSDDVVRLDRRQPEHMETFWDYVDKRVTDGRIRQGQAFFEANRELLEDVHRRYGVQPQIIVAILGLESNYGTETGRFRLVDALTTLAFDGRREALFRDQLLAFLQLMERGDVNPYTRGSWAGAMGQPQFLPTTMRDYAVDYDGDGRRDLWSSTADAVASAANFLAALGWRSGERWGREVWLPDGLDLNLISLEHQRAAADWQRQGVLRTDGGDLAESTIPASLVLPSGLEGGPAFIVYPNLRVILGWNQSILYALAVGHLADRIVGGDAFVTPRPLQPMPPLTIAEVVEMQSLLSTLGYDAGGVDGIAGTRTRQAVKNFQQFANLPADGYPSQSVLYRLRQVAGR